MIRAALLLTLLAIPSLAFAHGAYPRGYAVLFHPTDPDVLVMSSTVGFFLTVDGGETWEWSCLQAQPGGRIGALVPGLIADDGTLVLAIAEGVLRGERTACDWSFVAEPLGSAFTVDAIRDGERMLVLSGEGRDPNYVYESTDGIEFTPLGGELPGGYLTERVRVAPSDPMRIYVSGGYPISAGQTERRPRLFRSDDGGDSYDEISFELADDTELTFYLLDVDPADPDRIYAQVRGQMTDRLTFSDDAGDTWTDVDVIDAEAMPVGRTFGFARGEGDTVWFGNSASGLYRIYEGEVERLDKNLAVSCLLVHDGYLYMCADGLRGDPFALGRARIGEDDTLGDYEPVFIWDDVRLVRECGEGSTVTATCTEWEDDLERDLGRFDGGVDGGADGGDAGDDASDAAMDGGRDAGGGPGGGGCDCTASPGTPQRAPWLLLILGVTYLSRKHSKSLRKNR